MQVLRDTGTALNLSGERFSAFREIAINVTAEPRVCFLSC